MSSTEKTARINANKMEKKPKRVLFRILPFAAVLVTLVAVASAETVTVDPNIVDFANLSSLLSNIADLFPGIISLVTSILPLIFIMAIIGLIVGIMDSILDMVGGLMSFMKR
jgi:hypothetical protein